MVERRTALANKARSLAAEQGIETPIGIHVLQHRLPDIIEDAEQFIFPMMRHLLHSLLGVTNGAKVGLPQLGWRFSCQRTHYPSPQ